MTSIDYDLGCRLPLDQWAWLNRTGIFDDPTLRKYVSPFPPPDLMENVSGLTSERDHWSKWFHILDYRHGGIHAFQDILLLMPKKKPLHSPPR